MATETERRVGAPIKSSPRSTGKASERRERPRKRRAEVIDAAVQIFHEKGYEASTIQDIADAVGVLKGSLYYYFTSKEDVLFEILQEVHEEALAAAVEAIEIDGDPVEKIYAFVQTLARFNADNKVRMGILLHDFRSLSQPRIKQIVAERDRYEAILRQLILDGQEQQLICPDIDPKLATRALMGMINTIYEWFSPRGGRSSRYVGSFFASLAVNALSCSPDTHIPGHIAIPGRSSQRR